MKPYYDDGTCVIYHGEALETLPALGRGSAHAVVTDPPYVIGAVSAGNMASKSGGWADMMNSSLWFTAWYREVNRLLRSDGVFWSFCNWRTVPVLMRAASDARLPITSMLVWDKEWIGPGGSQGLRPSYELVALMAQPEFAVKDRGLPDIWRHKVGSYKDHGHPAEKPEDLVRSIILASSPPVDAVIVDPFLGSGTTAAAAKSLGYRFVGIEAEERWCEVAAQRLSQEVLDFGAVA